MVFRSAYATITVFLSCFDGTEAYL